MRYLFLLLFLVGCKPHKKVDVKYCVISCMEDYVHKYLRENYGSNDQFVDQFEKLCERKATTHKCKVGNIGGAYFSMGEGYEKK